MASLASALFTSDLWLSAIAILRYIPRSFSVPQVDGKAFYTEAKLQEFLDRVRNITADHRRQWGTMTSPQMLHHLNLACGSSLGCYELPDESYLLSRTVFRWILVDWYPEQPIGLRLPAGFKIPHDAQFDFRIEQQQLLKILDAAWHARATSDWLPHCMFGQMTPEEWGKLLQIHVDYHLRQFSA